MGAVKTMPKPWHQLQDEPEDCYVKFLQWLDAGSSRPSPPSKLAQRYDWNRRGQAWDTFNARPENNRERLLAVAENLLKIADIETSKHLDSASSTVVPLTKIKDVLNIYLTLFEASDIMQRLGGDVKNVDWDSLSDEEMRIVRRYQRISKKLGSGS